MTVNTFFLSQTLFLNKGEALTFEKMLTEDKDVYNDVNK